MRGVFNKLHSYVITLTQTPKSQSVWWLREEVVALSVIPRFLYFYVEVTNASVTRHRILVIENPAYLQVLNTCVM